MANTSTRPLQESVAECLRRAEFRRAYLGEALACMAMNDIETGKAVVRSYINGTVGFVQLGAALGRSPKSLMRMLSPSGNPNVRSFFEIVAYLQKIHRMTLMVQGVAA